MSLVPLPKVQCSLPKARKYPIDVPGTANVSHGHKLRERKSCRIVKHHGTDGPIFEGAEGQEREYEQLLKTLDFEKETDRKIRNKNLRQRVQRDMSTYEENLQARRVKLRDLVSSEEANLTREIVEVGRRDERARFDEKLARIEVLRKRHEEEHEATIAAKQMQRYLASCPDIKRELSRRCAIDARQCNAAQMADNEARRSAERELDAIWHEIMLRGVEASGRKEAEASERRASARREMVSTLAEQVADKLALEDERKRALRDEREQLERLREDVRRAESEELEMERRKREQLRREFEEQILTARRFVAERAREEATVDRALGTLAEEELARERARAKRDTAALRAESDSYLEYLESLRREEVARSREVEALVRRSHEDIEARREFALRKSKEDRRRAAQEVLRGREEQLRARREAEERERRLKVEEREALERQIATDADLAATGRKENRRKALRYGLELEEQRRRVEATRRRESEEERRYYRAETRRQAEECQRFADRLLNAPESTAPHPFKALLKLKGCLEKSPLLKKKEERCYCPATLTSA